MDTYNSEICGFLHVKSVSKRCFAQRLRKKSFVSSKLWKRLWCSVKKLGPGLGVQVQFESRLSTCNSDNVKQSEKNNSVIIPPNAVIYRLPSKTKQFAFGISTREDRKSLLSLSANSETETQRWMINIRHLLKPRRHCCLEKTYDISMVDNAHSKAAGLTGLYGDLIANETGIIIGNVHSGEIIENFEWKEFNQFHLMTAGRPEDVKRICVMHTTKEFRCGIGELYIFCLDANKLLQDLVTQGRGPKCRQRSWSFNNENLGISIQDDDISSLQLKNNVLPRSLNTDAYCLRTSINIKATKNIYQPEPVNLTDNITHNEEPDFHRHRKSDFSITSGIYEEISDEVHSPKLRTITSDIYEDTDKVSCSLRMKRPPPLPPRQKRKPKCVEDARVNIERYSPSEIRYPEGKLQNTEVYVQGTTFQENSNYVSMSLQPREINIFRSHITENSQITEEKEDGYVIMR